MRKLIGPLVQLLVGQRLALERHRRRFRGPLHLRLKEFMNADRRRQRRARCVPLHQELSALDRRQERQGGQPLFRIGHDAPKQRLVVPQHPLDRRRIVQVRVVSEGDAEALRPLSDARRQVELRDPRVHLHRAHRQAGELQPRLSIL